VKQEALKRRLCLLMKPFPLCALLLAYGTGDAVSAPANPRSWVALSAKTSATKYVTGAPIDLTLTAKNTHSRDAFLHFSSSQRFDVQLFKPGTTTPVYTWSATKQFQTSSGGSQLRLSPGQSQTFPVQIGDDQGALVPGKYQLRAFLTNSSGIEAKPVAIEVIAAPMQLQVALDKTKIKVGEPVSFTLTLTNTSQNAQPIQFTSGQRFDVSILNQASETVWNWAANKRFTRSISRQTLAPGESRTFQADWDGQALPDQKITPGTYTVQATSASNPRINAAPVRIEIK